MLIVLFVALNAAAQQRQRISQVHPPTLTIDKKGYTIEQGNNKISYRTGADFVSQLPTLAASLGKDTLVIYIGHSAECKMDSLANILRKNKVIYRYHITSNYFKLPY
jgi:hypothetical protein